MPDLTPTEHFQRIPQDARNLLHGFATKPLAEQVAYCAALGQLWQEPGLSSRERLAYSQAYSDALAVLNRQRYRPLG